MTNGEVILMAGVEGGGVSLRGRRDADGWRFKVSYGDSAPLFIGGNGVHAESPWLPSWSSALEALDSYGWHRLPGAMVRSEFREQVLQAVERRIAADREIPPHRVRHLIERWRDRCGPANQDIELDS